MPSATKAKVKTTGVKPKHNTRPTDPIKALTVMNLGDAGMSGSQAAAAVGIPERTAREIIARHGRWGEIAERSVFAELRHKQKAHLEATSRYLSSECLVQLAKTLDKASAYQAAGIYGLLRTDERLDAGESTQNIEVHTKHEIEGLDKLSDLLSQRLISTEKPADVTPQPRDSTSKRP
jgi:hypothetical protein